MQKQQSKNDSKYRITLSDIKGVGSKTLEKLESVGITQIEEIHLCRHGRGSSTANRLRKRDSTIGKDTWEHLAAVGKAVRGLSPHYVKAKHLTADFAQDEFNTMTVRIDVEQTSNDSESEEMEIPTYDTSELQSALESIWGEYEKGYGGQVSFEADLAKFKSNNPHFDEIMLGMGIVQSVMRYRHNADRVEKQRDMTDNKIALITEFGQSR